MVINGFIFANMTVHDKNVQHGTLTLTGATNSCQPFHSWYREDMYVSKMVESFGASTNLYHNVEWSTNNLARWCDMKTLSALYQTSHHFGKVAVASLLRDKTKAAKKKARSVKLMLPREGLGKPTNRQVRLIAKHRHYCRSVRDARKYWFGRFTQNDRIRFLGKDRLADRMVSTCVTRRILRAGLYPSVFFRSPTAKVDRRMKRVTRSQVKKYYICLEALYARYIRKIVPVGRRLERNRGNGVKWYNDVKSCMDILYLDSSNCERFRETVWLTIRNIIRLLDVDNFRVAARWLVSVKEDVHAYVVCSYCLASAEQVLKRRYVNSFRGSALR